jgi:SAM-dependent methyltransferase
MNLLELIHSRHVYGRRTRVLSAHLAALLPPGARVLDVGCGDGLIARAMMQQRPDVAITGLDVLPRAHTHIPVLPFDGQRLPCATGSVDVVSFIDVLHHTSDPLILLREAARVARLGILLKDHTRTGLLADSTLRFMDRVGNARYGVALPYNYWTEPQWRQAFAALGLRIVVWRQDLRLYVWPASWLFDRSLHVIAYLQVPPDIQG